MFFCSQVLNNLDFTQKTIGSFDYDNYALQVVCFFVKDQKLHLFKNLKTPTTTFKAHKAVEIYIITIYLLFRTDIKKKKDAS